MARRTQDIFIIVALAVATILPFVYHDVFRYFKSGEVGWALHQEIKKNPKTIDLAALTKFEWDQFYTFGPYEDITEICRAIKFDEQTCDKSDIQAALNEGQMWMMFLNQGKVAHTEMHFNAYGRFEPNSLGPLNPKEAVFVLEQKITEERNEVLLRQTSAPKQKGMI